MFIYVNTVDTSSVKYVLINTQRDEARHNSRLNEVSVFMNMLITLYFDFFLSRGKENY
jgi:hypothetical protein